MNPVGEGLKVNCPEGAREATLGSAPPTLGGFCSSVGRGFPDAPLFPSAGIFRRLQAATFFFHGEKEGKTPPGTQPMDYGSASLRLGP